MDNFVIGLNKDAAPQVEAFLENMDYDKNVRGNNAYINFESDDWQQPNNPFASNLMTYLFVNVGLDNYGFVRMGEDVSDNEIHGTLDNFGLSFTRTVNLDE